MSTTTPAIRDLPDVELTGDLAKLKPLFDAIKEQLQIGSGAGRGSKLDRWVRDRDLVNRGVLDSSLKAVLPSVAGPPGPPATYTPDLTPPPTPTGFAPTAGFSTLFFECDNQTYTQGHGHDRTVVYGVKWATGAPAPTFADAVELTSFFGTVGAYPTEPATRWAVWIKWHSIDGVESTNPAGGANGQVATTSVDPSLMLTALSGQITESQLYSTLGARIDLVDAPAGTAGSVNARIATETTARSSETGALFAQYTVKLDVNGYVSGYGLASTSTGAVPTSTFVIRSDSFAIASPSGSGITPAVPFMVRTTPGTVNGVPYAAGVYMDSAYILDLTAAIARMGNLWVTNAMIASLAVDSAKIANGSVVTAKIADANITTAKIANAAIGSAQIASAAVGTAHIADANVTTAKIANAAVGSAQIADASITTAKIGTAQVDTLQVAGNAITAPAGSRLTSSTNLPAGTETVLLSITVDPATAPVFVFTQLQVRATAARSGGSSVTAILYVPGGVTTSTTEKTDGMAINDTKTITLSLYDTRTSSGTRTYELHANQFGTGTIEAASTQTTIFAIGTKR